MDIKPTRALIISGSAKQNDDVVLPQKRPYIAEATETANYDSVQAARLFVNKTNSEKDAIYQQVKEKARFLEETFDELHASNFNEAKLLDPQSLKHHMFLFYNTMFTRVLPDTHIHGSNFARFSKAVNSRHGAFKEFRSFSPEKQIETVNQYEAYNLMKYGSGLVVKKTFSEMSEFGFDPEAQALLDHVTASLGEEDLKQNFPQEMALMCRDQLYDDIESKLDSLKEKGLDFVGHGDLGYVFKTEIEGQVFAFKLPIYKSGSMLGDTLAFQESQFDKFQELFAAHPMADLLPANLRDEQGQKLGIPGKVLVMKFFDGRPIYKTFTNEAGGQRQLIDKDYLNFGLDDQFLVDFIDFYLQAAKEGLDLHDIRTENMLYKPAHLQFPDLGGFNHPDYNALIELRKKSPEAFMLYEMMDSMLMFASGGAKGIKAENQILLTDLKLQELDFNGNPINMSIEERAKIVKNMTGHKYGQLVRVLEMAVKQGVISSAKIVRGIKDLRNLANNPQTLQMELNFYNADYNFTDDVFLDHLENHFKNRTGLRAFIGSARKSARNSFLAIKSKLRIS